MPYQRVHQKGVDKQDKTEVALSMSTPFNHIWPVLLLWIFYVFVLSYVYYVFVRVCLYVLCGHLLGKG